MPSLEGLDPARKLLRFLEKYAAEHPEFAEALNDEMRDYYSRAKPDRLKQNPFQFIDEYGEEEFEVHIDGADIELLTAYAKFLQIRVKRGKADPAELRSKIRESMKKSLNHGAVFIKPSETQEQPNSEP